MAKVKVTYRFEGDFEVDIEIVDAHITEGLNEWREDNPEGWEPTEDDVAAIIKQLLENEYAGTLDYTSDWNVGWDEYTDVDVNEILVPYAPDKVEQIDGQLTLDETELAL